MEAMHGLQTGETIRQKRTGPQCTVGLWQLQVSQYTHSWSPQGKEERGGHVKKYLKK